MHTNHVRPHRQRHAWRVAAATTALALLTAACGSDTKDTAAPSTADSTAAATPTTTTNAAPSTEPPTTAPPTEAPSTGPMAEAPTSATPAADLRAGLTDLLTEHVALAALATGAALHGDNAGFEMYAAALNGPTGSNTADLTAAITSAYGSEVGTAFDGLWRSESHIPAFVAYTKAVAADDAASAAAAVAQLTAYATTFGETLHSVNENLPADAVTKAVTMHATTLLAVIDAQKTGDDGAAYSALREAYHHMTGTAAVLAGATATQFPDAFAGDPSSPASTLRSTLHALLREHVFLAASATGAALGGRNTEFEAAAAALNGPAGSNTADIVAGITSVYGVDIGAAFDGLWRSESHIPAFVAYTKAVAADDAAGAAAAVADLTAYATAFGETLHSVNENLPADAVTEALTMHATTLLAVIDAQKAGDGTAAAKLREAMHHMSGTADVLTEATVMARPDAFTG